MRTFRNLAEDEIEVRISEVSKNGKYVDLLLYKTARTDAALLDETFGPQYWQNRYECINGVMYCGIGIRFGEDWIWKWNAGSESNVEEKKGEASDAMKRAGFVWGIGTELYSAPPIRLWKDQVTITESNGKYRCYDKFDVKMIGYDVKGSINELVITNLSTGADIAICAAKTPRPTKKKVSVTYEQALEVVPEGFDRPLRVIWKESFDDIKMLRDEGTEEVKAAIRVIADKISADKAAKAKKASD